MASAKEQKRLQKELQDIQAAFAENPDCPVTANMIDDNLTRWKGHIKGPEGSPYEGGKYVIDIQIPTDYPYNPPKMKFDTKIWHPNISSQTGAICLDILKNEWSPALTIRTALLSLQALLSSPEADDPQDAEVANMFKRDRKLFEQTAKYWTETFAKKDESNHDESVKKLVEMGFTEDQAKTALQKHGWDETEALNSLLGGA
ncbi:unnamed protein product [Vitrella brassicaformis CCMP3155]|uniref:E2 ubiquitin-conjugating enzyme n=2 Tax=Vitrella brassicaformis TaxID=1169539 RepID=A0A0G4EW07_VITBC|nr:unnamed protein product [Vitrella brassicaformis CCMP3155]|mmetsp:Transcript_36559/g.91550  ORF Transcript_36559/g.91550 Transcript_36559/m.91550 type:complete len:202 (+) Transcript_36559:153-758(+)|eukprot:CEM02402.1 unnamed protein product [Vitrella brassicaformis CCMP3155]